MNDARTNRQQRGALVALVFATLLAGCGAKSERARVERSNCLARSCTVEFVVRNNAGSTRVIKYAVRAKQDGRADTAAVVGEKRGQVELAANQARQIAETVETSARASQVVVTLNPE